LNKKIVIVTAPSGSGKSTIVSKLMEEVPQLKFSISATTRLPRGEEQDGKAYYFISADEFKKRIAEQEFLEWEMVYTNKYYGTLHHEVKRIQKENNVPILDIDVQGAVKVQANKQYDVCSIFIKVPSIEELKQRLIKRGTDTQEQIIERIEKAELELAMQDKFDNVILNEELNKATKDVIKIVKEFLEQKEPNAF
jgi:guanylate kinase